VAHADVVAHWPLDDGLANPNSTTAVDVVGSNHGTLQNFLLTPTWISGFMGGALAFDGGMQKVDFGAGDDLDITGALSITLWLNKQGLNANSNYGHLAGKNSTGRSVNGSYFLKSMPDDTLLFAVTTRGANVNLSGTQPVPLDEWHHMAVVFVPSTAMRIYLDGDLYAEKTDNVPASTASISIPFTIGHIYAHTSPGYAFNGYLDDIQVYNNALTDEQVKQIVNTGDRRASNPQPGNGQHVDVTLSHLSWTNTEPLEPGNNITCDVLFGTDPNMKTDTQMIEVGTSETFTSNVSLQREQVYFWQVICHEDNGLEVQTTEGPIWSFNTVNAAPEVDAGNDLSAFLDNGLATVALNGQVMDEDGFAVSWSVIEKPTDATVVIAAPTDAITTATFDAVGDYTLRLTATDMGIPAKSAFDELIISVHENAEVLPFTVVALPDTQLYSESRPDIFLNQTMWVAENANAQRIVMVSHLGDIVQSGSNLDQWNNADAAMSKLDGLVPYGMAIGNHDLDALGGDRSTNFRIYFGSDRFQDHPGYGGHSANGLNSYHFFEGGGYTFLSLHLDLDIPNDAIDWAQDIMDLYPNFPTIISTHVYLAKSSGRNASAYARANGNSGQAVWEKLIANNDQIFMTLNGHLVSERMEVAYNNLGHIVYQIQVDYQNRPNGGNGWLQMYTFVPTEDKIRVTTYSPSLNSWERDQDSEFDIPLDFDQRFAFASISMPVARWRLDDGLADPRSLIAQDVYGNHQGTLEDYAAPTWVLGKLKGALAFDGVSNNVDCGSTELLDMTGALTLMTWMNKTDATSSSYSHIIGKDRTGGAGGDSYYLKSMQDHSLAFGVTPADNFEIRGSDAVPLNEWHHIAAVFVPGERMTLYLDGQVYYEVTDSIPSSTKVVSGTPFTMGQIDTRSNGYALYGALDDVRLYDEALTMGQIFDVLTQGSSLIAHWRLDDGSIEPTSLIATDDVGIHHGILEDYAAPAWAPGILAGALAFDGISNNVDCGSTELLDMTGALTLMTWMNKTDATSSSYSHIIGKDRTGGAGGDSYYLKSMQDHSLAFGVTPADNFEIRGSEAVPLNEWHHIAAVFVPGERMTLYLDGQVYYEATDSIPSSTKVVSGTPFTMGQIDTRSNGYALYGALDDVRLYDQALTMGQIFDVLTQGSSLIAHWRLDDGSIEPMSLIATDDVGIHHGTLEDYAAPAWAPGILAGALAFDGVSNNVDCGSTGLLDMTGALTLMTWMNKTDATSSSYSHIIGKDRTGGAGGDSYYLKTMQDHSLAFGVTPADNFEIRRVRGSEAVPLNEWHHIAAVFVPGERMTLYLDGQVYYEVTDSIPSSTKVVPETPFTMGQIDTTGNGYALMGLLDDVRVYRVAMSQREITGFVLNSLIENE